MDFWRNGKILREIFGNHGEMDAHTPGWQAC